MLMFHSLMSQSPFDEDREEIHASSASTRRMATPYACASMGVLLGWQPWHSLAEAISPRTLTYSPGRVRRVQTTQMEYGAMASAPEEAQGPGCSGGREREIGHGEPDA